MKEFFAAALPWIVIGLTIAISCATIFYAKGKVNKKEKEKKHNPLKDLEIEETASDEDNYLSIGMSLGMCIGAAIGSALIASFGILALTYGICGGMLIGMLIGMNIKKK